jgi:hypothetical protein
MKAITETKTTVDAQGNITITGKIIDVTFPDVVAQRHNTILHSVNGHPSKPRHFQSNTHGFIFKRKGCDGVLFPINEMVAVGLEIDSKLTDVPSFTAHPTKDNLAGTVVSEIPATAKIQHSDDGKTWTDIQSADGKVTPVAGKFYRCVATNKNGDAVSNTVHFPAPKPAVK